MSSKNGRTALVTGGHGFLGSHLVDLLLARGFRVRCLLRPERPASVFAGRAVDIARGDLRRSEGLAAAVRGVDLVFHVAGLVTARGPAEFRAVNVEGTRRIAAAVGRLNPGCRRFVYVSSQAAAGPSRDGRPVREDRPPQPLTHYGRSKLGGERALSEVLGGVAWSIVRPPAIYGPRDEGILPFFQLAALGLAAGLEGPRGRRFNLLHARDVAEGMLAAAETPAAAGRTYFLADEHGHGYGYRDVARSLERAFGRRTRRVPLPDLLVDLAGVITDEVAWLFGRRPIFGRDKAREIKARWWLCSPERAARDLGWRARIPLDDGFAETARWYAEAGKLPSPRRVRSPL
ncbi:MAG: NAD-dependent epimerase/dehydratase family protein [Planctomycetota bacterium]|jgi:nucleoside-diphosphate-sugar epimerase